MKITKIDGALTTDLNPLEVSPENIWQYKQNKPKLIANDLNKLYNIPKNITHKILIARGVYKWLSVRRNLIKLKDVWKTRLTECYLNVNNKPYDPLERAWKRGYIKALEECRKEIRLLCHSERWQAPDDDKEAQNIIGDKQL